MTQSRIALAGTAEVRVESRNAFKYRHASGAVLAGRPDLVALDEPEARVINCKTGRTGAGTAGRIAQRFDRCGGVPGVAGF